MNSSASICDDRQDIDPIVPSANNLIYSVISILSMHSMADLIDELITLQINSTELVENSLKFDGIAKKMMTSFSEHRRWEADERGEGRDTREPGKGGERQ